MSIPIRRDDSFIDAITLDPERSFEPDCPVDTFYAVDHARDVYPLPCIACIDINPYDRNAGIGTRIVRAWETYLAQTGHDVVGAADVDNSPFWSRLGYRPIGPEDSTFWIKELS